MTVKEHAINGRDNFVPTVGPELAFPCYACFYNKNSDTDKPCDTCDYNASAKNPVNKPLSHRESVNHPDHYGGKDNPYEAIKVIEDWDLNFNLGNTVKYISRVGKKLNSLEDLKKARWYLDREINELEKYE